MNVSSISAPRVRLTMDEVAAYQREGYLIVRKPILPPMEFDALRARFEGKLAALPPDVRPEAMDVPHFTDPVLFRWLLSDAVLDLVEPLIGPDIALFSSHFICKPRGNGKRVPWHEDSAYWKGQLEPMEVVTVWLALDSSTRVNGGMMVIPRTHTTGRRGFSDYEPVADKDRSVFATEIVKPQRDFRAVPIDLRPNQCSLHDGRLMHASPPNHSAIRRCGYTLRYMPTTVKFNAEKYGAQHQIYLARGRDRSGNPYADPTRAYPDLARYREQRGIRGH